MLSGKTSAETNKGILLLFDTTITKNVSLTNNPINITENEVDWNSYHGKTKAKYSCFRCDSYTGVKLNKLTQGFIITKIPSV